MILEPKKIKSLTVSIFPSSICPDWWDWMPSIVGYCCCCCYQIASVMFNSVRPQRRQPTRLLRPPWFSRQEHWSGLPFPSPMHESEKWKWSSSVVSDSVTPWTAACQAAPSLGLSRQEYWCGVPLPSPCRLLLLAIYQRLRDIYQFLTWFFLI